MFDISDMTAKNILFSKLDVIDCFYETAAQPFKDNLAALRQYEDEEMDPVEGPSPYDEIQKNEDFLNLLGQSCICLMSTATYSYLEDLAREWGKQMDLSPYGKTKGTSRKIMKFYKEVFDVDLAQLRDENGLPFHLPRIKEIIDVRNTIQHENRFWDLSCWHGKGFNREFDESVFSGEPVMEIPFESSRTPPKQLTTEVRVGPEAVTESGARIRGFAECLEQQNPAT